MVAPRPEFARLQHALAAHLRDPHSSPPPPGIEDRRLEIYRHAVFAGIEGFMRDNYPRVLAAMNAGQWQAMVRDYLVRHVARATAFVDLPHEFLDYLEREAVADPARPFLYELAHFDWLETRIGDMEGLVLPTWAEVAARKYETWSEPRLVIDTATVSADAAATEVGRAIAVREAQSPSLQ